MHQAHIQGNKGIIETLIQAASTDWERTSDVVGRTCRTLENKGVPYTICEVWDHVAILQRASLLETRDASVTHHGAPAVRLTSHSN